MPQGYGVGLRVATIPIAQVQPLSGEGGSPPGGGSPPSGGGGSIGGDGSGGGLGAIGLIGLLLIALGIGVPALVSTPDEEQAQVQPSAEEDVLLNRIRLGGFAAE